MQLRVAGLALLLLVPAGYLAWEILSGHASPIAWLGVAALTLFGGFQVVLLRALSIADDKPS